MDSKRYDRIRAALTPKRRELFGLMCAEAAMGRWEELAPEDTRGLYHIRWRAVRRTPDIYRQHDPGQGRTYTELVFVNLCTTTSVLVSHASTLAGGSGPHSVTLTRAEAVDYLSLLAGQRRGKSPADLNEQAERLHGGQVCPQCLVPVPDLDARTGHRMDCTRPDLRS